jgi:hypothetical protein
LMIPPENFHMPFCKSKLRSLIGYQSETRPSFKAR